MTYQIQHSVLRCVHCSLHSPSDSPLPLGDADDKSDAARLIFGGRSQSRWTSGSRPSKIPNADCLSLPCLIVTTPPEWWPFCLLFSPALLQPRIPPLHWPHDRCVTDSGRLPPSPFSFHCLFLYLFPFSFPVLLPGHLSCGAPGWAQIITLGRDDLGQSDLHIVVKWETTARLSVDSVDGARASTPTQHLLET